jgi:hypothetical protein
MAFGHTFRSYSYPQPGLLYSGETTPCIVTTAGGQFVIQDTHRSEDDYVTAVEQADLAVTPMTIPGRVTHPPGQSTRHLYRSTSSSKPERRGDPGHLTAPAAIKLTEVAARHRPNIPALVRCSSDRTRAKMIVPAG